MLTGKEILKNNPITNIDITNAIGHIKGFNGVSAHDMLPSIKKSKINFGVVNYHNYKQPGSHWVAYYYDPNEPYTRFFDSYGLAPSNRIKTFLLSLGKPIVFNAKMIQSTNSNRCGWYSIYFILASVQGTDYMNIISNFMSEGKLSNDKTLIKLLN